MSDTLPDSVGATTGLPPEYPTKPVSVPSGDSTPPDVAKYTSGNFSSGFALLGALIAAYFLLSGLTGLGAKGKQAAWLLVAILLLGGILVHPQVTAFIRGK